MDIVILGFLMIRVLSQYDLKKALGKELSPYYSASLGNIQSALKRLCLLGYCSLEKGVVNGRKKNAYQITDQGRQYFLEQMEREYTDAKFEAESSTRLFFLGLVPKENRLRIVKQTLLFINTKIELFEREKSEEVKKEVRKEYEEIVKFQLKCLNYEWAQCMEAKAFYQTLLNELEE